MEDGIFRIKNNVELSLDDKIALAAPDVANGDDVTIGFTKTDNPNVRIPQTTQVDKKECYAKYVQYKDVDTGVVFKKYFVKIGPDGFFFNPWGFLSEGTESRFHAKTGQPTWVFQEVKANTFELYLTFLNSRNPVFLTHAERSRL